jgi:hypothetical protein
MAKNVFTPNSGSDSPKKPTEKPRNRPTLRQEANIILRSMIPSLELNASLFKKTFFLLVLIMFYIALNHSRITTLSKIESTKRNLASERALYLNLKGLHERQQRQSALAQKLTEIGSEVGLATEPSKKIVVKSK